MSLLSQFYPSGGNGGTGGIPLDMLVVSGGGGSGAIAGMATPTGNQLIPSSDLNLNNCGAFMASLKSGSGGGGAVYEVYSYPAKPGVTYPITVGSGGAGGTGGASTGTRGANGGSSAFTDPTGEKFHVEGGGGGGAAGFKGSTCIPAFINNPLLFQGASAGTGGQGGLNIFAICNSPTTPFINSYEFHCGGYGKYHGGVAYRDSWQYSCTCPIAVLGGVTAQQTRFGTRYGMDASTPKTPACTRPCEQWGAGGAYPSYAFRECGLKPVSPCLCYCAPDSKAFYPNINDICNRFAWTNASDTCGPGGYRNAITGQQLCYSNSARNNKTDWNGDYQGKNFNPNIPLYVPGPSVNNAICGSPISNPNPVCRTSWCRDRLLPSPCLSGYGAGGAGVSAGVISCSGPAPNSIPACYACCYISGPGLSGSPGTVIVKYPDVFGTIPGPQRPGSEDCSPNTPGFRTYRFTSPGSITLP
jgi:hypothetical protein